MGTKRTWKWATVLAVVALSAVVGTVLAQGGTDPIPANPGEIPELPAFLKQLAGPGGPLVIGVLISILAVKWPWFQKQGSDVKWLLAVGISVVVAVVAQLLLTYVPGQVWEEVAPYWTIVAAAVLAWAGNQAWYQVAVKPHKRDWVLDDSAEQ